MRVKILPEEEFRKRVEARGCREVALVENAWSGDRFGYVLCGEEAYEYIVVDRAAHVPARLAELLGIGGGVV